MPSISHRNSDIVAAIPQTEDACPESRQKVLGATLPRCLRHPEHSSNALKLMLDCAASPKYPDEAASYVEPGLLSSTPVSQAIKPNSLSFFELYKLHKFYSAQNIRRIASTSYYVDPAIDSAGHIESCTADDAALLCRPRAFLCTSTQQCLLYREKCTRKGIAQAGRWLAGRQPVLGSFDQKVDHSMGR